MYNYIKITDHLDLLKGYTMSNTLGSKAILKVEDFSYKLMIEDKCVLEIKMKDVILDNFIPWYIAAHKSWGNVLLSVPMCLYLKLLIMKYIESKKMEEIRNKSSREIGAIKENLKIIEAQLQALSPLTISLSLNPSSVIYRSTGEEDRPIMTDNIIFKFILANSSIDIFKDNKKVKITEKVENYNLDTLLELEGIGNYQTKLYSFSVDDQQIDIRDIANAKIKVVSDNAIFSVFTDNRIRLMYSIKDLLTYDHIPSDIELSGIEKKESRLRHNLYNIGLLKQKNTEGNIWLKSNSQYKKISDAFENYKGAQAYISGGVKTSENDVLSISDKSGIEYLLSDDLNEETYNKYMDSRILDYNTYSASKSKYNLEIIYLISLIVSLLSEEDITFADDGLGNQFSAELDASSFLEGVVHGFYSV